MKSFTVVAALFAAAAVAQDAVAAIQTVDDAVSRIRDDLSSLNDGVTSFDGSADSITSLDNLANTLVGEINDSNSQVSALGDLGQSAVALVQPFTDLRGDAEDAVNNVVGKKSDFDSAQVGGVVYAQLKNILDSSQTFADTIISKVPEGLRQIAQPLADGIIDPLSSAVNEFADLENQTEGAPEGLASATSDSNPSPTSGSDSEPTESSTESETTGADESAEETGATTTDGGDAAVPTQAAVYGAAGIAFMAAVMAF